MSEADNNLQKWDNGILVSSIRCANDDGLYITKDGELCYWGIGNLGLGYIDEAGFAMYDGENTVEWSEIPQSLYDELLKHENEYHGVYYEQETGQ